MADNGLRKYIDNIMSKSSKGVLILLIAALQGGFPPEIKKLEYVDEKIVGNSYQRRLSNPSKSWFVDNLK